MKKIVSEKYKIIDLIKDEKLQDEIVLINIRLYVKKTKKTFFAGYFVIEKGKYKYNSGVDGEEWDELMTTPIYYYEKYEPTEKTGYKNNYCVCFFVE